MALGRDFLLFCFSRERKAYVLSGGDIKALCLGDSYLDFKQEKKQLFTVTRTRNAKSRDVGNNMGGFGVVLICFIFCCFLITAIDANCVNLDVGMFSSSSHYY